MGVGVEKEKKVLLPRAGKDTKRRSAISSMHLEQDLREGFEN